MLNYFYYESFLYCSHLVSIWIEKICHGSVALLWHNAKVLALSKVLTLMGYNQNFFIINPILIKLGDFVVTMGTTSSPSFIKIGLIIKKFWL